MILSNISKTLFLLCLSSINAWSNVLPEGVEPSAGCTVCNSSLTFSNPEAEKYKVGNQIPLLPFKTKTSWAGNIPIPDTPTVKNGSLFFWLFGQDSVEPSKDLVIWFNGGPGSPTSYREWTFFDPK